MKNSIRGASIAFTLMLIISLVGCGDGKIPLGKVSGVVTVNGKPLRKGQIEFFTDARPAYGTVENGEIVSVITYKTGDGVPLGIHQVAIRPKIDEAAAMSPPKNGVSPFKADLSVPTKYQNAETSGLTAEIKRGENKLTFELNSE